MLLLPWYPGADSGSPSFLSGSDMEASQFDTPVGQLEIRVKSARNLPIGDWRTQSSDPYVRFGVEKSWPLRSYRTRMVPGVKIEGKNGIAPVFEHSVMTSLRWNESETGVLLFEVFDHNEVGADDKLGMAEVPIKYVAKRKDTTQKWEKIIRLRELMDEKTRPKRNFATMALSTKYYPTHLSRRVPMMFSGGQAIGQVRGGVLQLEVVSIRNLEHKRVPLYVKIEYGKEFDESKTGLRSSTAWRDGSHQRTVRHEGYNPGVFHNDFCRSMDVHPKDCYDKMPESEQKKTSENRGQVVWRDMPALGGKAFHEICVDDCRNAIVVSIMTPMVGKDKCLAKISCASVPDLLAKMRLWEEDFNYELPGDRSEDRHSLKTLSKKSEENFFRRGHCINGESKEEWLELEDFTQMRNHSAYGHSHSHSTSARSSPVDSRYKGSASAPDLGDHPQAKKKKGRSSTGASDGVVSMADARTDDAKRDEEKESDQTEEKDDASDDDEREREREALLKGHQSGEVACQFGKNAGPKDQFHDDVIIELLNGTLTFAAKKEISAHLISRKANVEGCIVKGLKTARKGHEHAFRIDLDPNTPDSKGEIKYVISVKTPEEATRWMSIFGAYTASSSASQAEVRLKVMFYPCRVHTASPREVLGAATRGSDDDWSPPCNGTLSVQLIGASGLVPSDENGCSDPFVVFRLGFDEHRGANDKSADKISSTKKKTVDPHWAETFLFGIDKNTTDADNMLTITMYDKDFAAQDDYLGSYTIDLTQEFRGQWLDHEIDEQFVLEDPEERVDKNALERRDTQVQKRRNMTPQER